MRTVATLILLAALAASPGSPAAEALAPLTGAPPYPADNPPTAEKIALGKKLFFDTRLSGAKGRSCGTCHRPELLYADGLSRAWSLKESELRRKTPSLFNVAWQRRMFHDARAGSLEEQAAFPLRNDLEMDLDPEVAAERVRQDPEYQKLFAAVFPGQPLAWDRIAQAMAAFERTLVSRDSPLDRYLAGDRQALSAAAQRGLALFSGEAGCLQCHKTAALQPADALHRRPGNDGRRARQQVQDRAAAGCGLARLLHAQRHFPEPGRSAAVLRERPGRGRGGPAAADHARTEGRPARVSAVPQRPGPIRSTSRWGPIRSVSARAPASHDARHCFWPQPGGRLARNRVDWLGIK